VTVPIRVADRMAQVLHRAGVRHAFGMPGGEIITFVDALATAGIDFVLARNETAAAMMAAGTTPEAARPGLLVTTLGPGLANGINGIADAMQERCPLIVVSGTVEARLRGRFTHQIVDHRQLLTPLVKASFEATAETAGAVMARAIRLAMTAPCGPVHIDLSPTVAAEPTQEATQAIFVRAQQIGPDASDPHFADIRARLRGAERPLIIAGLDAVRDPARDGLDALVAAHGIPVMTTYKAKGLVAESNPMSLGAAGLSPRADGVLLDLVQRADLVLLLGYDPIEMRAGWLDPFTDPRNVVELGTSGDHGMHQAGLTIDGRPVQLLTTLLAGEVSCDYWTGGDIVDTRARLKGLFRGPESWGPHAVFETLQARAPAGTVLTVDSGAHRILLSQRWCATRPFEMLQSAGWCTMGSAIPLAIGQKLVHPGRPVVAVLGDGGLEMTLGELGTLRDQTLPITILVLQDRSLELIGLKQDQIQLPRRGVSMGETDYAGVATAFGGTGVHVQSVAALEVALRESFAAPRFTLICCLIEQGAYNDWI
jgi:acetolactate synthase-1/2/3 large subunit